MMRGVLGEGFRIGIDVGFEFHDSADVTLPVIPDARSAIRNPGANAQLCHPLGSGFFACREAPE
jgi:hypothetical protein